jgi:hypothetical protein
MFNLELRQPNTPTSRPDVVIAHYAPTSTHFDGLADASDQLRMVWPGCEFRAEVGAWYVTVGGDDVARLTEEK